MRHKQLLITIAALLVIGTASAAERVRLATTTSAADTGLLDSILPPLEKTSGIKVDVIAVGTGKALKLAGNGDVDAVLVHDPEAEEAFIARGEGVNRRAVMYNDFILAGPAGGAAVPQKGKDICEALRKMAAANAPFVSRGDSSGTHQREKKLWKEAGVVPGGGWYLESGQGMIATLKIADEKGAYCLTDRASFTSLKQPSRLAICCEGDPRLLNQYSIIAVSPAKHPDARYISAMSLIAWLTSPEGQLRIGDFKKNGKTLFHPNAYGEGK